ncbi:MAG: family 78 glycoside hydrolase catalytic domain [Clostridia bacterium]|nr:family 78 glycoside hydrolase catalytic domain [Clostridia bacterium]
MLKRSKWISYPVNMGFECPVIFKSFKTEKEIKRATLTISARGCYYATLNGERIGNFIFAPGATSLKRVQVQSYDVTNMLGFDNTIEVTLSKGWFQGRIDWRGSNDYPNDYEAVIAELSVTYKDGSCESIVTDESWSARRSAVRFSDFYDGEHYDATFIDESIVGVKVQNYDNGILVPQQGEFVVEHERIRPINIFKTPKGELVIDFGQNLTGYFEIFVNAKSGERVSFSFAEVLDVEGNFYTENYRSAKAEFLYTCCDGEQSYKPKLAFWGYRYIRVNEFPCEVTLDSVVAIVVHSDIKRTGYLESSSPLLNKLFKNIIWGQKGNFLDIPTDCPQRDEREGWTGDAQVFCRTASYNYDVEKFFEKWLTDLKIDQGDDGGVPSIVPQYWGDGWSGCGWGDASTICPWQIYLTYGNKDILRKQYSSMCKWLKYIALKSKNRYLWTGCEHFADWLGLDAPAGSYKGSSNDDFLASAYYLYSTSLVIKAGKVLGRSVQKYEALYERILKAIRKKFKKYKTQTECVIALHFGIAPDKEKTAKQLADMIIAKGTRLQTGFLGTPYLLHALSDNGYSELAYDLLLQEAFPSWLYSVKQGATTIWEHWDGVNEKGEFWSKDMNSFNHYAYGAVADWVYGVSCGIKTVDEFPGFERIVIAPIPTDKLDFMSAQIQTRRGLVSSKWFHEGGTIRYEITTPSRTTIIIDGKEYNVEKGSYIF